MDNVIAQHSKSLPPKLSTIQQGMVVIQKIATRYRGCVWKTRLSPTNSLITTLVFGISDFIVALPKTNFDGDDVTLVSENSDSTLNTSASQPVLALKFAHHLLMLLNKPKQQLQSVRVRIGIASGNMHLACLGSYQRSE
eukprot:CAMPEP_0117431916 /NCGR_PEP_ID=MMETSP0758-20121206/11469_1 /TAXON_ID=63605 /ORGANISM="Percolomonas cosmopolitus, Strain AE-1 (ATCC 50343)" /LENGTH=138 /DNA_ID=CAMNT_0005221441 /DNA_START=130 /DNA_END=543 /DNA_ORIENTATION=+